MIGLKVPPQSAELVWITVRKAPLSGGIRKASRNGLHLRVMSPNILGQYKQTRGRSNKQRSYKARPRRFIRPREIQLEVPAQLVDLCALLVDFDEIRSLLGVQLDEEPELIAVHVVLYSGEPVRCGTRSSQGF